MKYAYQITSTGEITFCSGENIIFWKEITQKDHDTCFDARHKNNQIIYVDKNGKLQSRDKLTIWDEVTSSWVPDVKAIRNKANNEVINQARQAYQAGNLDRHQFSKLSPAQQTELGKYLDKLLDIVNLKESQDDLALPVKPKFLK